MKNEKEKCEKAGMEEMQMQKMGDAKAIFNNAYQIYELTGILINKSFLKPF